MAATSPRRTLALNGAAWARLRACVLRAEPLCRHCQREDKVTAATDVDHINNDSADNRMQNLQPLCHSCHSRKTCADRGHRVRPTIGLDGWPVDA